MKRLLIAVISAALLVVGARTVAQAEDPPDPEQFADTGLPEKESVEAEDARLHSELEALLSSPSALAAVLAAKTADSGPNPSDDSPAQWEEGIFDVTDAPASTSDFVPTTLWSGHLLTGLHVAVYAGQQGSESTQGRILISLFNADGELVLGQTVDIPGAQTLTITSASSLGVVLTDTAGDHWTVNPATGLIL